MFHLGYDDKISFHRFRPWKFIQGSFNSPGATSILPKVFEWHFHARIKSPPACQILNEMVIEGISMFPQACHGRVNRWLKTVGNTYPSLRSSLKSYTSNAFSSWPPRDLSQALFIEVVTPFASMSSPSNLGVNYVPSLSLNTR